MDSQGRCKNCKWWHTDIPGKFNFCFLVTPDFEASPVAVLVGDGKSDTKLKTQADFGCVLFEAKEEAC
jgi:hypothetical protein